MVFVIGILTFVMVLVCLLLILLVLIQLPKKEAGAGVAFGGAATDALFGAGSGNVLTKVTKYAAGAFFVLALLLSVMQSHLYHRSDANFINDVKAQESLPATPAPAPAASATTPAPTPATPAMVPAPAVEAPSNAAPAK